MYNLRPSTDTCEKCHRPEKFTGDMFKVYREYMDDEANTPLYTALLMHLSGGESDMPGIHSWHITGKYNTTYLSTDEKREQIDVVRVTQEDGTVTEYRSTESTLTEEEIAAGEFRPMDCIDCHNRPTHIYKVPSMAVDNFITEGRIDRSLPYIRQISVEALTAAGDAFESEESLAERVRTHYSETYPEVAVEQKEQIEEAIVALQEYYDVTVFPEMKVKWDTYPDNIGHTESLGCFRCHDDEHVSPQGDVISQDCTVCHNILAWEEEDPEILTMMDIK